MTFLPVVQRELRVAARRRYTYWTRFLGALACLGVGAWIWGWLVSDQPEHQRGLVLFKTISGLAFTYSILAGIGITSDSLSEEKREGTLGLLFLTDLKGYDVVLGKLVATSINALYRLFAIFPILAIPLILGGLTFAEVGRMALVLTNTLFFSLCAGMIASAICTQERRAMLATFLLILTVTAGPPLVGLAAHIHNKSISPKSQTTTVAYNETWLWSSAVYPSTLALDKPYKTNPRGFWSAVGATHALAWAFLIASSVLVRMTWQDRPAGGRVARWQDRWRDWQFGQGSVRVGLRRRLLDINPMLWRNGRDRLKAAFVFGLLIIFGVVWLLLELRHSGTMLDPTVYFLTAYCLHTIVKFWLAAEACRPFAEDRRTGALELVLSTPLAVDEILEGEILALKRHFGWPATVILGADLLMLMAGMRDRLFDNPVDWFLLCFGIMIMFVADLYTLAWVGMWLGLTSRKGTWAVVGNIARVLILPWAVFLFGLSLAAIAQWRGLDDTGEFGLLVAAFLVAMLFDAFFFNWARSNLRTRFRLVATQRFQSKSTSDSAIPVVGPDQSPAPPILAQ